MSTFLELLILVLEPKIVDEAEQVLRLGELGWAARHMGNQLGVQHEVAHSHCLI